MHLHAPDLFALVHTWHLEQHVRANPSLECGIEIRREVGGEDDDAVEALDLLQQHVDHGVRLADEPVIERRRSP